ncbi:MAG: hypothetical protein HY867_06255 [Chloroflexi bacterium]|nr:hypothetical protein [Chloroflexota bacterium]
MSETLVKVIEVKTDPRKGNPPLVINADYGYGINSKEKALAWGAQRGYMKVYYWKARQRAFAERTLRVDLKAKALEQGSQNLSTLADATYQHGQLDA